MEFIVNNWGILVVLFALISVVVYFIIAFTKMPSSAQIEKVKEWLLFAVAQAEKEFGSGTGQLKLRYVYDMFIAKFPYLAKVISFEQFSILVDEVLKKFENMLNSNKAVKDYVNSEVK